MLGVRSALVKIFSSSFCAPRREDGQVRLAVCFLGRDYELLLAVRSVGSSKTHDCFAALNVTLLARDS
jgi:hypothetical protein